MKQVMIIIVSFAMIVLTGCNHKGYKENVKKSAVNVLFLHHSTGNNIYNGGVEQWCSEYNKNNTLKINFFQTYFPKAKKYRLFVYGWNNYPYDYYNIWVKHGDAGSYKDEPTLKTLTPLWDVIIFKHCYPSSAIVEDGKPDIDSPVKTLANYKLQYEALKKKLHEYPDTKFILWTGAVLTKKANTPDRAERAKEFHEWVKNVWDEPGDNIYLWDFYELETGGGVYLTDEYAVSPTNSHPNKEFSAKFAPLFCQRVVDVIKNNGSGTNMKGEKVRK
jgi:hypothetical protein